ncbi:MAG: galactose-1-phosphate uridylyltransferase [Acidobacteria bacterium]|jgi:UDPglucose--hexose-1-phosphate uridylyltransferase|nr:galactose-1-phosphate uridylyltransferase [Acidobacteriota bacterium]
MSQLRLNPLTGRWVTLVADRAKRPTDFAPRLAQVEADPSRPCPFCPGNEEATPPALEQVDSEGKWTLRVVPNLYPAFEGDGNLTVRNLGPVHTMADASGIHEVFVITPDHTSGVGTFADNVIRNIMTALRRRFEEHARTPNVRYTQAFINHGREAGASLSHPHGQILGLPFVPGEILEEERAFERFKGGCILCATIDAERVDNKRVVLESEHAVVVAPYWSGSPYELLIIPESHDAHLTDSSDDVLTAIGIAIRDAIRMLNNTLGDVAYNLVFHTAPSHHAGNFHWHVHLWPKLTTTAGFEKGTGVLINIVPPEDAAFELLSANNR